MTPEVLALVGPTSSGKTALSVLVARRLDAEIISMDSRSVFRGMDVGTAKPTPEERGGVPHHGIDLVEPDVRFSAGEFSRYARPRIAEIRARGRVPMLVGGTGFFLRALTHPIFREPEMDPEARARLTATLEALDDAALLERLREMDPEAAVKLSSWGGRQRLMRTLEVPLLTGRTLAWWHAHSPPEEPPVPTLPFVLDVPRPVLKERIDRRVEEMVRNGLLDEVRGLLERYGPHAPGLNAHGYAELIPYFAGERTLDEALELVRRNTKSYTKRQATWFRTQLPEGAVWLDGLKPREELADEIAARWRESQCESA